MLPLVDIHEDVSSFVQLTLAARVGLRSVTDEDQSIVQQWFELSSVEISWGSRDSNWAFFRKPPAGAEQRIIVVEGVAVGYIRWQILSCGTSLGTLLPVLAHGGICIDVLVGPRERRFLGIGSVALRRVREDLAPALGPYCCFGLTNVHHLAARRAYEKAGFRHHYFYDDPRMGPAVAMVRPVSAENVG